MRKNIFCTGLMIVCICILSNCHPLKGDNEDYNLSLSERKLDFQMEKSGITVSSTCSVKVPDEELAVYSGSPILYDTEEKQWALIEELFPEYEEKKDEMQHVSSVWGESYKYKPSDEYEEKLQFTSSSQYFYIHVPDFESYVPDAEISMKQADAFIKEWFPKRQLTPARLFESDSVSTISLESDSDHEIIVHDIVISSLVDQIPSAGFSILYSGNDKLYTGENFYLQTDKNGVYRCSSSTFLESYDTKEVYKKGDWLEPEEALECFLEMSIADEIFNYDFDEAELLYVLVPVKNKSEEECMKLSPIWHFYDSVQKYHVAVDAINGEIYQVFMVLL